MKRSRKKRSIIWTISIENLQFIIDNSSSYVEVLSKLGFNGYNGNHRTLKLRLKEDEFDLTQFNKNYLMLKQQQTKKLDNKICNDEIFIEDSKFQNNTVLKTRLIELGIPYICGECKISNTYNNKPIVLQLDHINGINNDNRLFNLRLLCPNCHSQTLTFSGRNKQVHREGIEPSQEDWKSPVLP